MTRKTTRTIAAAAGLAILGATAIPAVAGGWGDHGSRMMERMQDGEMHRGLRGMRDGGPRGFRDNPVFQSFDTDGDGTVTGEEAETGLAALLQTHDADGDGALSRTEFDALFASVMTHRADRPFAMLDANEDGMIDAEEMAFPAQMMRRMQRMQRDDG